MCVIYIFSYMYDIYKSLYISLYIEGCFDKFAVSLECLFVHNSLFDLAVFNILKFR